MFSPKCFPEISSAVETASCGVLLATWLSLNQNEEHISASRWNLHSSQAAGSLCL